METPYSIPVEGMSGLYRPRDPFVPVPVTTEYTEFRDASTNMEDRRQIRVRCCHRYEKKVLCYWALFGFVALIVYTILQFTLDISTHTHETIAFCFIWSLFGINMFFMLYLMGKSILEKVWKQECMIPFWCGCRWIERHQLHYES